METVLSLIAILLLIIIKHDCFSLYKSTEKDRKQILEYEKDYEGTLRINYGRRKRSVDESDRESVHLELTVLDYNHEVHLRKTRDSIFGDNFHFGVDHKDSKKRVTRDVTPSKNEINSIEDNHYIGEDEQAAFSINNVTGEVKGYMKDMSVSTVNEDGQQKVIVRKPKPALNAQNDVIGYIGQKIPSTIQGRSANNGKKPEKIPHVKPEALILWDLRFYQFFKGNNTAMLEYTALYFRLINYYYSTMDTVKIKLIITGMRVPATVEAQDEMIGKKPTSSWCRIYDVNTALSTAMKYREKHAKTLPKNDLGAIIADVDFQVSPSENASCGDGLAGLAMIGPCGYYSMSASQGARDFGGLVTVAHEMGHTLGAGHTTSGIMGSGFEMKGGKWFEASNENQFKTSIMYYHCLRKINEPKPEIPEQKKNDYRKTKITFKDWCKKFTYNAWNAKEKDGRSANENCKDLHCQYFDGYTQYESFGMAFDYTICDNKGGYCKNGRCMDRLDRLFSRIPKVENVEW